MAFDETLLDHAAQLEHRDTSRLLWSLAGSGAQVRRAIALRDEFPLDRLGGEPPRALLVATDAPASLAQRLVIRLSSDATPAIAWHGVDLPPWAGAADALLVGAVDGRHPRLAELTAQAVRRGLGVAVVTTSGSPALTGDGVDRVIHLRTMHLGPEEILVGAKIALPPGTPLNEVASAIDSAEQRIRDAVPTARVIYLEPDLDRSR